MITEEIIEKNKKDYYNAIKAYNICPTQLIDELADKGLFESPASTMKSLHNAFVGGLVDHLLRVTNYAIKINETLPSNLKQDKKSIVKVGLLHSIGKVGLYTQCKSEWHIKNLGKMYEFNEDLTSMTVGERSLYYILPYSGGMDLKDFEYQAILNYEKDPSDKMSEWHTHPLGVILKMAVKLAIMDEKTKN